MKKDIEFKYLMKTEEFKKGAELVSRNAIFIALATCGYCAFFEPTIRLGFHWLWLIPSIMFGISILVACPLYYLEMYAGFAVYKRWNVIPNLLKQTVLSGTAIRFYRLCWELIVAIVIWNLVYGFIIHVGG